MLKEKLNDTDIGKITHLQPDGWPDIKEAFRFYCAHDFCNPIKVTLNNEIVGVGCTMLFEDTAWLSHIIVHSDFRKRGIGRTIVESLLEIIKTSEKIKSFLLIATELGIPVYLKLGFREVSDYVYFTRKSSDTVKYHSNNIHPYKDEFYSDIIELDTYISGENRERLIKNYLKNSYVFIRNKIIEGFYIPDLGDGAVFALTLNTGIKLMRFKYSKVDKASIPAKNLDGIKFIKQLGFTKAEKYRKRMMLGQDIEWKPQMIYNISGGNFG